MTTTTGHNQIVTRNRPHPAPPRWAAEALEPMPDESGGGTGTPAVAPTAEEQPERGPAQTFVIIGNHQPGQVVKIVFLTVEEAVFLPDVPPTALQIAVFPAGNS